MNSFFFFWLCWVFVSVRRLSLVSVSGGHSSLRCAGLSLSRPLLLRGTGSRCAGSVVVAHGPSCSVACGIFPDQGSNPCPLHWQADSQPLCHQGSPNNELLCTHHPVSTVVNPWPILFNLFCAPTSANLIYLITSSIKFQYEQLKDKDIKNITTGTSLVAQWLRIRLLMQGTWVRALVQEDPTCCGATKPIRHNY